MGYGLCMMTTDKRHSLRETDGRYAVGFDAMCVCGHTKGCHAAGRRGDSNGECLGNEAPPPLAYDGECDCPRFRKSRSKEKRRT